MTVTSESFRVNYPEFADTSQFPDQQVGYWLSVAPMMFDANRWGTWLDLAIQLYMAHNMVLEARAIMEANNGGIPGITTGAINSKSADKISVGFDTANSTEEGGGQWNTTIFGTRLYRMLRMIGAGPIQVGACTWASPLSSINAYPGPWYANFPNPS